MKKLCVTFYFNKFELIRKVDFLWMYVTYDDVQ